jgi:hypothetical protein
MKERDLFPDVSDSLATLDDWRQKLVLANVHLRRMEALKKLIGGEMSARIKHYKKVSGALADAVRFKSTDELQRVLGGAWEQEIADIKPLDRWHDSLNHWFHIEENSDAD